MFDGVLNTLRKTLLCIYSKKTQLENIAFDI